MEPLILRYKDTATGGSTTTIVHVPNLCSAEVPALCAGLFDGAAVRIYRLAQDRIYLLDTSTVACTQATPARAPS